ncbi:MAG: hypothetical protein JNL39_09515 [Opitutaceae bacterium]|nr:hypothetical protein [Opitutaceae bacterium]
MDAAPPPFFLRARRVLARAALLIVAVLAGVNVADVLRRVPVPPRVASAAEPDSVARMERRLARLRHALETRRLRGVVGYVADVPAERVAGEAQATVDYYQAQFALAPAVLDLVAERHGWVVTNLRTAALAQRMPAGYVVVEDFGEGVALLRKAAP